MPATVQRHIFAEAIRPREELTIAEWAVKYRRIGKGTSNNPGRWNHDLVPHMVEVMEAITKYEDVILASSAQISKTEGGILNTIGYFIHHDPSPMLCVLPDWDTCNEISRDRFEPAVRDTPVLTNLVRPVRSVGKVPGSTIHVKRFPGGRLNFVTANSSAALSSKPIRIVLIDELDRCSINREGDIYTLAKKRTETFQGNRHIFRCSTPTFKNDSPIMEAYEQTDQRKYFVDCPYCEIEQEILWKQVKYSIDSAGRRTTWYDCPHCERPWSEFDRRQAISKGRWKPTATPKPGFENTAGFWIWAGYSLFTSFDAIVKEHLAAEGNKEKMQVFVNTVLAETWEDPDTEKIDTLSLVDRHDDYKRGTVPAEGLLLTAGVDVQLTKLVIVIRAWARDGQSYLVDWLELDGDPFQDEVWDGLAEVLKVDWEHALGKTIKIKRCAVDSSGFTSRVYTCVDRLRRVEGIDIVPIKGSNLDDKPVVNKPTRVTIKRDGKPLKNGLQHWTVGVSSAKTLIYGRLAIAPGRPYSYHFPQMPERYFEELTSEERVPKIRNKRREMAWQIKKGVRNEVLDCEVYALFAAMSLGIDKRSFGWAQLQKSLILVEEAAAPVVAPTPVTGSVPSIAKRRRQMGAPPR